MVYHAKKEKCDSATLPKASPGCERKTSHSCSAHRHRLKSSSAVCCCFAFTYANVVISRHSWWCLYTSNHVHTLSILAPSPSLDLEMKVKHNRTVKWAPTDNCSSFDLPVALLQLQRIRATPAASGVFVLQNLPPSLWAHELPLQSLQPRKPPRTFNLLPSWSCHDSHQLDSLIVGICENGLIGSWSKLRSLPSLGSCVTSISEQLVANEVNMTWNLTALVAGHSEGSSSWV